MPKATDIKPTKHFLADFSELTDRFDPTMVLFNRKIKSFKYTTYQLKSLLLSPPQYGANESGTERLDKSQPRYIRITDIDDFGLLNDKIGVTAGKIEKKYILQNNDMLFARSGATVGKAYLHKEENVDYECFFAGYMIRFIVDGNRILPDYLFAYTQLNTYKQWVKAIQRAAGQPNINAEEFKSLLIPLPPISKQAEIVSAFNNAYLIKKEKENSATALLNKIDSYILNELGVNFTSKVSNIKSRIFTRKLSEVIGNRIDPFHYQTRFIEVIQAIKHAKYKCIPLKNLMVDLKNGVEIRDYVEDGGTRYLRVTDLDKHGLNHLSPRYVLNQPVPKKIKLNKNCLLVSRSGSLGLVNVVEEEIEDAILSSHIFKLELDVEQILPKYLETYLRSSVGQSEIFRNNNGGVIPEINQQALGSINIVVPPIEIQQDIIEKVKSIYEEYNTLKKEAIILLEKTKNKIELMILE